MSSSSLSIAVVWSDPDLLEIETSVCYAAWAGRECAYVTRAELRAFAGALDDVAQGAAEAALDGGQSDLGYVRLRLFEYGAARRLGLDVTLGHAGGRSVNRPDYPRELRVTVPLEREPLALFAHRLREMIRTERGEAHLTLLPDWPW